MQDYITWSWKNAVNQRRSRGGKLNQTFVFKHRTGHQIELFPPHIGFSSRFTWSLSYGTNRRWKRKQPRGSTLQIWQVSLCKPCLPSHFLLPSKTDGDFARSWYVVIVKTAPHSRLLLTGCWQWLLPLHLTCSSGCLWFGEPHPCSHIPCIGYHWL